MTIDKNEEHITNLHAEVDPELARYLGEMVVAYGRLEDMFKVVIMRLKTNKTLAEIINEYSDTLAQLIISAREFPILNDCCNEASRLNTTRQDFIHATYTRDPNGRYIRFRKLAGYADLGGDISAIKTINEDVYRVIKKLNEVTS